MNYYERHLGDYARDTAHLSMVEHGAYTLLMDRYYATERGIPEDQAHRVARARTSEERAAVDAVLAEFFTLCDGIWKQKRADQEVERFKDKQSKAKASANARWSKSERNADAMPTQCEGNALQSPVTSNQEEPLSNPNGLEVGTKVPPCPMAKVLDLYHEVLPELPKVEKLTDARKGYIRQRWLQDLPTLDSWRNYFTFVRSSNFLMGRAAGRDGQPPFRADIEFLTKPASYAKIAEEKYHR